MKKILIVLFLITAFTQISFSQWTEQSSGVTTQLTSVSAVTDNVAWMCGYAGKVIRTTNGGTSWISATGTGIPATLDLYNMYAVDSMNALVTGSNTTSYVYRTSNGGTTWTQVFSQTGGFIDAIWMTSPLTGVMYGDPVSTRWSLWKTTNGGLSWDSTGMYLPQIGSEAGWNNALYVSGTSIWFGTNSSKIYYSPLNGTTLTWVSQTTPNVNSYSVWFNGAAVGLSGGAQVMGTSNNGTTWTLTTVMPGSGNVSGITGVGTTFWVTRQEAGIYRTDNNGTNWTTEYTAPAGVFNHIGKARTGTRLWGARNNGSISKSDGLTAVIPISTNTPGSYQLSQNYPNPFNPTTNIRFAIPKNSLVTMKVYDALGREVTTLVNEFKNAGTYQVDFNALNLSSGIYFYTIKAADFAETKKMMLVK